MQFFFFFWCTLSLLLNADINCPPDSVASGCSSWNNTALTELWRVYGLVPAVKWGGFLWANARRGNEDLLYKWAFIPSWDSEHCYECMCHWLLSFVFTKQSWRDVFATAYFLNYGKDDTHFNLLEIGWRCMVALGARKYFIDRWHKVMAAPPSLFSDENYAVDWWQQHLKSPPFSHPTGINWSAPRRGSLLSKILMCQYIYGTCGSMFLLGRKNSVNI